ncbi:MAG: hemolysin family protein [Chthoniobacterales bacterium]|nr:hemolysin family protein [Chthoniobacterales bacterium]
MLLVSLQVLPLAFSLQPSVSSAEPAFLGFGEIIFLKLLVIFLLVLLNALFVASEFAIVKIRSSQVETLVKEKYPHARRVQHIINHLDVYLSATQLGVTLASLGLGWVGEPFLNSLITPLFFACGITSCKITSSVSFLLAFTGITFLHIVLGEQAPKTFAIRKAIPTALWLSPFLTTFYTLFRPAISLLNSSSNFLLRHILRLEPANETALFHSEEELRLILGESTKSEEITPLGQKLALNAFDLRHHVVRDIMTPRSDVIIFDLKKNFQEELAKVISSQHTRFPICSGELDEASGFVHIKDLLGKVFYHPAFSGERSSADVVESEPQRIEANGKQLASIQHPILHVSEMMPLEKLLSFFLSRHAHLAIAIDEYGGAVGIVTLDNVLEELVGSIQDEFDNEEEFKKINEDEFEITGSFALHDLAEITELSFEGAEVSTIAGYITQLLDHLPQRGDEVLIGDYRVTVKESDGKRVLKVHFKRLCNSRA